MASIKAKPSAELTDTERILEAVARLTEEVRVLRTIADELRDEFGWALNNVPTLRSPEPPPFHLTSMPLDPAAEDWGERLNRYRPSDLPAEHAGDGGDEGELERTPPPKVQGDLFEPQKRLF